MIITLHQLFLLHTYFADISFCPENTVCFLRLLHNSNVIQTSMFCCMLLYVHSSIAIILMRKRELISLLNFSSWCLVMVEQLFLVVLHGCLQFVIVVFPDHTHLLFLVVVLLLLIYCFMYLPLFVGVLCWSLFLVYITLCPF